MYFNFQPLSVGAVPCGLQNSYTVIYESGSGPTPVSVQCSGVSDCMDTFDVTTKGSNYTVSVMGFDTASPMEVICELYGTSTRQELVHYLYSTSQTVQAL